MINVTAAPKCPIDRPITSGQGTWDALRFQNQVLEEVMSAHGCTMEFLVGSTPMILPLYQQGKLDVMMEMWKDNLREIWDKAVDSGMWIPVGPVTSPAVQGTFIPRFVQEQYPEIKHAEDLKAYSYLFKDPEDPSKGRYVTGLTGWNATIQETNRVKRLWGDAFNYREYGDASMLSAEVKRAVKRKQPIALYWWFPDGMPVQYDLVYLPSKEAYHLDVMTCFIDPECKDPRNTSWKKTALLKYVTKPLLQQAPSLVSSIQSIHVDKDTLIDVMRYGMENDNDFLLMKEYFFKQHKNIWMSWNLPKDVKKLLMDKYGQ